MNQLLKIGVLLLIAFSLTFGSPSAFAKHDEGHTPPGWSHGKKTGWNGEDLPPGLAKKEEGKGKHKHKKHKKNKKAKRHQEEKEEKEEKKEEKKED